MASYLEGLEEQVYKFVPMLNDMVCVARKWHMACPSSCKHAHSKGHTLVDIARSGDQHGLSL